MARTEKATALQIEISATEVTKRIYTLRGFQVMLDRDLAELYKVETKVLKRAVKANIARFPQVDFMFEVQQHELEFLRCKICTSNNSTRGGTRYAPFAFTELGVAMLSSVLHSPIAIQINIEIMRLFVQLRKEQKGLQIDLVPKLESMENMFRQKFAQLETQLQNQAISTTPLSNLPAKRDPMGLIQNAVARHFGVDSPTHYLIKTLSMLSLTRAKSFTSTTETSPTARGTTNLMP